MISWFLLYFKNLVFFLFLFEEAENDEKEKLLIKIMFFIVIFKLFF